MNVDFAKRFGTRECPSCAGRIAANNNRCPICGYALPALTGPARAFKIAAAVLMMALALLLFGRC